MKDWKKHLDTCKGAALVVWRLFVLGVKAVPKAMYVTTKAIREHCPLVKPAIDMLMSKKWILYFALNYVVHHMMTERLISAEIEVIVFTALGIAMLISQALCDKGRDAGKNIAQLYGKWK